MNGLKYFVFFLAMVGATYAFDDITGLVQVYCDASEEEYLRAFGCADQLPGAFVEAQNACMQQVAQTTEKKAFRAHLCDTTKTVVTEMKDCMLSQKSIKEYELSSEDTIKMLDALKCVRASTRR